MAEDIKLLDVSSPKKLKDILNTISDEAQAAQEQSSAALEAAQNAESNVTETLEQTQALIEKVNELVKQEFTGLRQVLELPVPTIENKGTILQYIGETNEQYENGHTYKSVGYYLPIMNGPYAGYWADQGNELSIMPSIPIGFEGRIVRYIGETNEQYTYGKFYEWYDPQISGSYSGAFRESSIYATSADVESAIGNVSSLLGDTEDLEV